MNGWIKLHRTMFDNPVIIQSPARITVWLYLLTHATPKSYNAYFGGKEITLQPGQLITSRKSIANCVNSGISDSSVERALKAFERAHQIEQQTSNKNRLVTLLNWDKYQTSEQQNEQQTDNKRTTSGQQADTNGEYKKRENLHRRKSSTIHNPEIVEIVTYLNSRLGTRYKPSSANTKKHISARLSEGYSVADFHTVIDSKVKEWSGTDYQKYLRPDTLFGSKFEGYLNVATAQHTNSGMDSMYAEYAPAYRGGESDEQQDI